jgi:hypothetical protein
MRRMTNSQEIRAIGALETLARLGMALYLL